MSPLLTVQNLRVGYGDKAVLEGLSMEVPERGITALMGPAGVGKSTFLRTLSRWNEALPTFWRQGSVRFAGADLFEDLSQDEAHRRLALLRQKARFYVSSVLENSLPAFEGHGPSTRRDRLAFARLTLEPWGIWQEFEPLLDDGAVSLSFGQQRRLALVRLVAEGARCLLVDEPFRDLPDDEADELAGLLRLLGESLAVILSSHHQGRVRGLAARVHLLCGGAIVEESSAESFFTAPRSDLAQRYIRLGNCWLAGASDVCQGSASPAGSCAEASAPASGKRWTALRPSEFHWLLPDRLAGCQQPGLLQGLDEELAGLTRLGCQVLVSLRQQPPSVERLAAHGLESCHCPVPDMGVPSVEQALDLCRSIDRWLDQGRATVLHCKAGLGRTGTLLACFLVHRGATASQAVERIRAINPRYIQSDEQLAFVGTFSQSLLNAKALAP